MANSKRVRTTWYRNGDVEVVNVSRNLVYLASSPHAKHRYPLGPGGLTRFRFLPGYSLSHIVVLCGRVKDYQPIVSQYGPVSFLEPTKREQHTSALVIR